MTPTCSTWTARSTWAHDLLPRRQAADRRAAARGKAVRFLSNTPTKDPLQYTDKLARLGLPTPIDAVVNTTVTMTRWPLDNHPDAVVFPISEAPLKRAVEAAGIRMSDDHGCLTRRTG
jgi:ribonucleotide monophosphatase NagD (HAD superfamily)